MDAVGAYTLNNVVRPPEEGFEAAAGFILRHDLYLSDDAIASIVYYDV